MVLLVQSLKTHMPCVKTNMALYTYLVWFQIHFWDVKHAIYLIPNGEGK